MISRTSSKKYLSLFLIAVIAVSVFGIFFSSVEPAQATWWDWILGKAMGGTAYTINLLLYPLDWLIGQVLSLVGRITDWVLNITNFTDVPAVNYGWKIVRDFANMFFILIWIFIAFATILRIETYGLKSLLPKLIIVALLINFSFVIAGFFIDFAQILTHFFITQGLDGGGSITGSLTRGFHLVEEFMLDKNTDADEMIHTTMLASNIMNIIFKVVAIFVFLALAVILIIRILIIWFLLIVAPIVWLLWVLPATRGMWSKWWNMFLKWTFFAPIYAFFLYLALYLIKDDREGTGIMGQTIKSSIELAEQEGFISGLAKMPELLLQYILIIGILIGGLFAAQSMGIYGASALMKLGKGTAKGVGAWAGTKASRAALRAAAPVGRGLAKVPIVRHLARPIRGWEEKERANIAKAQEKYKTWSARNIADQFKVTTGRDKTALGILAAEKGALKYLGERGQKTALQLARRYNLEGSILKAAPHLAPLIKKPGQSDIDAIRETIKGIKPSEMHLVVPEAYKNEPFQEAMLREGTSEHFSQIAKTSLENMNQMQKAIDRLGHTSNERRGALEPINRRLTQYIESNPGQDLGWTLGPQTPKTTALPE